MLEELAETIEELGGVVSCKVTGKGKELDEIHVIADKNREPKRIVRDIETVTLVNCDLEVDHKKISIAQVDRREWANRQDRIQLVSIYREHNRPVCKIKLRINEQKIEETVKTSVGEPLTMTIARGMVEIIDRYTGLEEELVVKNVFTTGTHEELVIVQLEVFGRDERGPLDRLVGAVYVNHDLPLAIGKACLKALNRMILLES